MLAAVLFNHGVLICKHKQQQQTCQTLTQSQRTNNSQLAPAMHDYRKYSPQALSAYIQNGETSCVAMSQPHYSRFTQKDNSCICYMLSYPL